MALIDYLLEILVEKQGSDLHLTTGVKPYIREHGDLKTLGDEPPTTTEMMKNYLLEIIPKSNQEEIQKFGDTDFAYEFRNICRLRTNVFMDINGMGAVFRVIPSKVPTFDQIALPKVARQFCDLTKGLVLVTGPTGSGKSTTLAAMVDYINKTRRDHIITIEDPIEFVYKPEKCLINQREVKKHTQNFKRALRAALREDPDVVLVGEMRDLETMEIALETAETGHLVFGTLHTSTASSTVDRLIDQFPADRQPQIRSMLSNTLRGVISQTLCKRKPKGRVAVHEILVSNAAVAGHIREGRTHQIPNAIQSGGSEGMTALNTALLKNIRNNLIDPVEAYLKAVDKLDLRTRLESEGMTAALSQISYWQKNGELMKD